VELQLLVTFWSLFFLSRLFVISVLSTPLMTLLLLLLEVAMMLAVRHYFGTVFCSRECRMHFCAFCIYTFKIKK
jgi:hypothetical protein